MGSLFGGYLSQHNDVCLFDVNAERVDKINSEGITILEPDGERNFRPRAVTSAAGLGTMDLVIVFVKSMFSRDALAGSRPLIGNNTYVMSLQNGMGHEDILSEFVSRERIIIGATQHNSSITGEGYIHHGGGGKTVIGLLEGDGKAIESIANTFSACGIEAVVSNNVKKHIWNKLFLNVSASALTAVLQVQLGFMLVSEHAGFLMERLVREAVNVANADGLNFDPDEVLADIKAVLDQAREGYTSIYADIKNGVPTEVDTISGSVVKRARQLGVSVPSHEFIVELVHALEDKNKM
jgi:2-dehydropantoate 2-reductase